MNITFITEGAGYRNQFGYFLFNQTTGLVSTTVVFPDCTFSGQVSTACMVAGDTVQMPPSNAFFPAGLFLGFWVRPDGFNKPGNPIWWSFEDRTVPNSIFNVDNKTKHTAWVYLTDYNATLFGFEDLSLGDADYNDVMFTFTIRGNITVNQIPVYSGGLLQTCRVGLISAVDYLESQCYQWALLQPPSSAQCAGFIEVPSGWIVAPNDNITQTVIQNRGSTWAQSIPSGCLVVNAGTSSNPVPYAYTLTGDDCNPDNFVLVKYGSNNRCFSTLCANKILIRSTTTLAQCTALTDTCSNTPPARILFSRPATYVPIPVWPTEQNVYMQKGTTSTLDVPFSVTVPPTPPIDIMILFDVNGAYTNDITLLSQNMASFATELTSSTVGFDIPNIGFATYTRPSSGSPYVTVNCALQLADTLATCVGNVKLPGTSAVTSLDLMQGVADLMNSPNSQVGWRTTAYRFVLVISDAAFVESSLTTLASTMVTRNVVPVFYNPNPTRTVRDQYNNKIAAALPLTSTRQGTVINQNGSGNQGSNRMTGWASNAARSLFRPTYLRITFVRSGDATQNSFINTLPSQLDLTGVSNPVGVYQRQVNVKWGSAPTNMPTTYALSLKVLGFSSPAGETINIITNNPPNAPSAQFSATQNTPRPFVVPASDVDGNQITISFACPLPSTTSIGYLRIPATNANVTCGTPLSVLSFEFVPSRLFFGTVSFNYTANDGCDLSPVGTITFVVARVNIPPVALPFTVYVNEGETLEARQLFTFLGNISDADDAINTLRIRIDTPPTGSLGRLRYPTALGGAEVTSSPDNRLMTAGSFDLRYVPNGFENGQETFPYTVLDPSNAFASSTVTVVVVPVNNNPVLTAPSVVSGKAGSKVSFTVTVTENDMGDSVRVDVLAGTGIGTHTISFASDSTSFTGAIGTAYTIVKSRAVSTSKPYTYTVSLEWTVDPGTSDRSFVLQAFDAGGLPSNTQTVRLTVDGGAPPIITTIGYPSAVRTATGTNNVYNGLEEATITVKVSGSDDDIIVGGGEWRVLAVVVTSLPLNGQLQVKTGASSFTNVVANFPYNVTNAITTLDSVSNSTIFEFRYTGNTNYVGTDFFTYIVQDTRSATSSPPDTVTITLANVNDAPTSNNVELYMDADTTATITGIGVSDPDTGDLHYLILTSLPLGPSNTERGVLRTPGGADFAATGVNYTGSWDFQFTPVPNECSSWTAPVLPPYATFRYRVCDNGSPLRCSTQEYTGTIYVRCVNHPPTSRNFIERTPQNTPITINIPANDVDEPDTDAVLKFQVTSFAPQNRGKFYYNGQQLDEEVGVYVLIGRNSGEPRSIVYVPETGSYSLPLDSPLPLATFLFQVVDSKLATSPTYRCDIIVDFVNQPPVYLGDRTVFTDENVPLNLFLLYPDIYTDDGLVLNGTVSGEITSVPTRGTFQVCEQLGTNSVCKTVATTVKRGGATNYPLDINVYGRVVFIPDENEWGDNYAFFTLTLRDSMGASSDWTFTINVREVNQPPVLTPLFSRPPTVFEDELLELEWRVHDVDSLPSQFTTTITTPQLASLSRFGWSTWQCTRVGTTGSECVAIDRDTATPIADRASGFTAPIAKLFFDESTCIAAEGYPFTDFTGCYAIFKVIFGADRDKYGYQYTQWTFTAQDGDGGASTPLSTIIVVLPVNDPPVVTAPASVSPAAGVNDPTIQDSQGNVLVVADPDALQISVEELTFEVLEGDGELVLPASARCTSSNVTDSTPFPTWTCLDTIRGFNRWLPRTKFEMNIEASTTALLRVTLNDRGAVGVNNLPHLTDTKNVTIIYTPLPLVVTPPQTNNYLTLAVGIAAAAGILLLALLAWRLRKRFSAPNDDYFQVAVAPLSVAPQNPLYKAQFKEHFSPLYNPDAGK